MNPKIELLHFYVSPGHNFFGHHGGPAGNHPIWERTQIQCRAGRGIEGDRFFDHKNNYKGQITFLAQEVFQEVCDALGLRNLAPSVLRRNVVTHGIDLNELVGKEFEVQGVRFVGIEQCKPCYWMNQAMGPGAEEALQGRRGLRAKILTDGLLRLHPEPEPVPADPEPARV
jgi:MOSC domain-containing protein YiiM